MAPSLMSAMTTRLTGKRVELEELLLELALLLELEEGLLELERLLLELEGLLLELERLLLDVEELLLELEELLLLELEHGDGGQGGAHGLDAHGGFGG